MSNLGKIKILIPPLVTVHIINYDKFNRLCFIGPTNIKKAINLPLDFQVNYTNGALTLNYPKSSPIWGTVSQHIRQIIQGITIGFKLTLNITGIGYKASCSTSLLSLSLGFSHDISLPIPTDILVTCPNNTTIHLNSNSLLKVSAYAHKIAAKKPALKDKYKKKGIIVI